MEAHAKVIASVQHVVLNVKALVGSFNQEKALVGAFSVIMNLRVKLEYRYKLEPYLVSSLHLQDRTPSLAVAHLSPLCASLQEISWLHGCPWPSAA